MNYLIKALLYILSVSVVFFMGCSGKDSDPEPTPTEIPIGIVVSLTGSFSPYGPIQQNGILLAISEINSKSLLPGKKITPYIVDDRSVPDTCQSVFLDLINTRKVVAIIGPTSSNSAFAADTIAQNRKVVVVGISNTVPGITGMGDYIFRNSLPESAVIPNTVQITHDALKYSKVAVVYGDDDPYTLGAYNSFKSALESTTGVSIIATETVHKGDYQFTDPINRIKASAPDIIVLALLVNEASRFMVQARNLGIPDSIRFLGGNSFNTSKLWQQAGNAAQGAICGTAWIYTEETPGNAAFIENYISIYGARPDQFAAQAYAAIYILADALKRSGQLNSTDLCNALAATANLPTVLGMFSFDGNRDPVHSPVVQELIDGEFVVFKPSRR